MQNLIKRECESVFKQDVYSFSCDSKEDISIGLIHAQENGDENISQFNRCGDYNREYIPQYQDWNNYSSTDATRGQLKQVSTHRRPLLPPCVVCGETSTGFHYGANTCEACKGFFRRNLRKEEVLYKCKCTPELQEAWKRGPRKNGCQACRFKRCLAMGMSRNAIKLGRYTYNHKTENIRRAKYIEAIKNGKEEIPTPWESSPSSSSSPYSSSSGSQHDAGSPGEFGVLGADATDNSIGPYDLCGRFQPMKTSSRKAGTKVHLHDMSMTQEEIELIVSTVCGAHLTSIQPMDTPIETIKMKQAAYLESYKLRQQNQDYPDTNGQMSQVANLFTVFEEKVIKAVSFAKKIPGLRDLRLDDQASLIKASRCEITLLGAHNYLTTHVDTERQILTTPWGEELHFEELGQVLPIKVLTTRHQYARRVEDLGLTMQELSITRAIVTIASDRCELIEPDKVDALQQKLVTCLQHLLNIRPGGPGSLLYRIFNLITDLRDLTDIEGEMSKKLLSEWPMVSKDNFYLLKELST